MQALHISPLRQEGSDLFPVACSELINQLLKAGIFLGCPPVFLGVGGCLGGVFAEGSTLGGELGRQGRGKGRLLDGFEGSVRGGSVRLHHSPQQLTITPQPPINKNHHHCTPAHPPTLSLAQLRGKMMMSNGCVSVYNKMANNSQKKNAARIESWVTGLTIAFWALTIWFGLWNSFALVGETLSIWGWLICALIVVVNWVCYRQVLKCWELNLPPQAAEYYYDLLALNALVMLLDPIWSWVWNLYWLIVVYLAWQGLKWLWEYITPRYEPTEEEQEGGSKKKEKKEKKEKVKYLKR